MSKISVGGTLYARWAATLLVWQLVLPFLAPVLLPKVAAAQSSELTPISTIQGAGLASPFDEQDVTTWGWVTGVTSDGFYLQDPVGDGDSATSDGLFVYTYDAPTVTAGQCVRVAGEIVEYYAKTELNWLTAVTPSEECGAAGVTPVMLPMVRPGDDPTLLLEALEGMVVHLDAQTGIIHGPTKRFESGEKELAFLPTQWQRYFGPVHLFHDQAAISGLLYLSNRLGASLPDMQWGDLLHVGDDGLIGVLDYNYGKYQLLPWLDQPLTVTVNEVAPTRLSPARADEYGICSFNLHGFGQGTAQFPNPADYALALQARTQLIASQLPGCTVIALQETGTPVDANVLAERLAADYGLAYRALSIAGPASDEAEFPLTNSILVDSSRVTVEVVEAIVGCSPQEYDIVAPGACPLGQYPVFDRPPLMAKLVIAGPVDAPWTSAVTVWVIDNHWKSKSGDESANARLRAAQATVVAERVQAILTDDPAAQIVVLGDLNDFYQGAAVSTLQSATGLFHPYEWLPPLQRYSYLFNGAAQVLDHALVTPNLASQLALVQILHLNADAPMDGSPLAHSDHDPVVLRIRPAGAAVLGGMLKWGQIDVSASDEDGNVMAQATTDANGDFRLWGVSMGTVSVQFHAPAWIVLDEPTQTVEAVAGMMNPTLPSPRHTTAITGAWLALNTPWLAGTLKPR